jgi:hypothetical protein
MDNSLGLNTGTSCNTRSLFDEIQKTKTEIGILQYRLISLERQLYGDSGSTTIYKSEGEIPQVRFT